MAANTTVEHCAMCTEPGLLQCGGCKAIRYCSVECREASWRFHKSLCKTYKDFQTAPGPDMYRALYFPPNARKPEFRWLSKLSAPSIIRNVKSDIADLVRARRTIITSQLRTDCLTDELLERPLMIYTDDDHEARYSTLNKAIAETTHHLVQGRRWGGPIVVVAGQSGEQNFDLVDYQRLLAFFIIDLGDGHPYPQVFELKHQCVMLPCAGESRLNGITRSRTVMCPLLHLMGRTKSKVSAVSERIGMPLLVLEYGTKSKAWTEPGDLFSEALFLHIGVDLATGIAYYDPKDIAKKVAGGRADLGNVLIARGDGQPLVPEAVDALVDFCQSHLHSYYLSMTGRGPDSTPTRAKLDDAGYTAMWDYATPTVWADYLTEWKALMADKKAAAASIGVKDREVVIAAGGRGGRTDRKPRTGLTGPDAYKLLRRCLDRQSMREEAVGTAK